MKYLMIGAGAIGTYIGTSLLSSGCDVRFLEREESRRVLEGQGVILQTGDERIVTHPVHVYSDIREALAGGVDVVVFAMKSFDTFGVAQQLEPYKSLFKVVLCLQNGVENESTIASILGSDRVMAGSVTSAVERIQAGHVRLEKKRGIGISGKHDLLSEIIKEFNQAGLNARSYPHGMDMKWSKMLSNLLANATSAILNMTPAEVYNNKITYRIEVAELKEAIAVMDRAGYHIVDLPGVPMKLLAAVMLKLPVWMSRLILARVMGKGRGGKMPSFHIDLHSGRQTLEAGYLNGAVSRYGKNLGIPTPVNDMLGLQLEAMAKDNTLLREFDHNISKLYSLIIGENQDKIEATKS